MMENRVCRRWVTTNQDEYEDPTSAHVNRDLDSREIARYENCTARQNICEEQLRSDARGILCQTEQDINREPVVYPTDSHIDECAKTKESWCRCLATGDPNCYDEYREDLRTDALCCCQELYRQTEPTPDYNAQKLYSSTYFIDYRDPDYQYNVNGQLIKEKFDNKFKEYKSKVDTLDAAKEPKIVPPPPAEEDRVDPNCLGLYDSMPEPKRGDDGWKADESWWRNESSQCRKDIAKKSIWTSTYREMNKDGAALPITILPFTENSLEKPAGDPSETLRHKPEMAPCTLYHLGDVFTAWDRPQIRHVAGRCDTMYNRPPLEYDTYFKDHYLHRAKFARCPEHHEPASRENMELARKERLRIPYDRTLPGYMGYPGVMMEAPTICKVKKPLDHTNPDLDFSTYQVDYMRFPSEYYKSSGEESYRPFALDKLEINGSPINPLSKIPLPPVSRLSCYLECNPRPPAVSTCN